MTAVILPSSRVRRPHPPNNLVPAFSLYHPDVILALQIEPELRTIAEIASKPHRRVGRNRTPAVKNIRDTARRYAEIKRKPIRAKFAGGQLAL
jgi:hypothetical protein